MLDLKSKVILKDWNTDLRSQIEIDELSDIKVQEGVILSKEKGQYLVEWKDLDGNMFRSFHYVSELEEKVEEEEKPATEIDWDDSKVKVAWLKEQGFKYFATEKEGYFVDKRGNKRSIQEVGDQYNIHVITQQVYPRLAALAAYDGDFAREENGVGFNKLDTVPGHSLVDWYKDKGFWAVGQLLFAIKLQHKYKNQLKRFMGNQYKDITTWRGIKILNKETGGWITFPEGMLDEQKEES